MLRFELFRSLEWPVTHQCSRAMLLLTASVADNTRGSSNGTGESQGDESKDLQRSGSLHRFHDGHESVMSARSLQKAQFTQRQGASSLPVQILWRAKFLKRFFEVFLAGTHHSETHSRPSSSSSLGKGPSAAGRTCKLHHALSGSTGCACAFACRNLPKPLNCNCYCSRSSHRCVRDINLS